MNQQQTRILTPGDMYREASLVGREKGIKVPEGIRNDVQAVLRRALGISPSQSLRTNK